MPKPQRTTKFSLALITGASSGIGAALCHLLARQGIPLLITGRDEVRLHSLVQELQKLVKVTSFAADLKNEKGRQRLIEKIHHYKPDLVINNAGFGLYGEALTHETGSQIELLNVNTNAVLESTLEAAKTMIGANKTGVILNVSSAAGELIFPSFAVYSSSKAFVTHFSQSLDFELQPHGVRVLVACPGVVNTPFRARASGMHADSNHRVSMSAECAAKQIWKQIEERKRKHIFDWKTRWGIYLSWLISTKWLTRLLSAKIQSYQPVRPLIINQEHQNKK